MAFFCLCAFLCSCVINCENRQRVNLPYFNYLFIFAVMTLELCKKIVGSCNQGPQREQRDLEFSSEGGEEGTGTNGHSLLFSIHMSICMYMLGSVCKLKWLGKTAFKQDCNDSLIGCSRQSNTWTNGRAMRSCKHELRYTQDLNTVFKTLVCLCVD